MHVELVFLVHKVDKAVKRGKEKVPFSSSERGIKVGRY